jgi:hypothetical protein
MKSTKWTVVLCLLPSAAIAALSTAQRKSQFEKAMASIIAASMPQTSSAVIERVIKEYLEAKPNKGQAIQLAYGLFWRSTLHEDASAAGDRTLEACQLRYGKPCALIAVNDEIVVDGDLNSKDMPRLHYVGQYDVSQIPIIRLVTQKLPDVQSYDKVMEPKAMALHPWGTLFISAGNPTLKDAEETALAKCNNDPNRQGRDGGCFLYAINNDVVISERRASP